MDAEILRSVSRSFYLSIRFLPVQLREPIALAYLLARTTDTVADTAQISGSVRMETLKLLSNRIQGTASRDVVAELIASFVSLQENVSERQLLESLSDCLGCLEGMEHADRNDIRLVLEKITRGQMFDLQRFDNPQEIRALSTAADLSFGRDSVSGTFASSRAGPKTRCLLWESVTAWRFNWSMCCATPARIFEREDVIFPNTN